MPNNIQPNEGPNYQSRAAISKTIPRLQKYAPMGKKGCPQSIKKIFVLDIDTVRYFRIIFLKKSKHFSLLPIKMMSVHFFLKLREMVNYAFVQLKFFFSILNKFYASSPKLKLQKVFFLQNFHFLCRNIFSFSTLKFSRILGLS